MSGGPADRLAAAPWFIVESGSRWAEALDYFWSPHVRQFITQSARTVSSQRWAGQPLVAWAAAAAAAGRAGQVADGSGGAGPAVAAGSTTALPLPPTGHQVWLWALPLTGVPLEQCVEAIAAVSHVNPAACQLASLDAALPPPVQLVIQQAGVSVLVPQLGSLFRLLGQSAVG